MNPLRYLLLAGVLLVQSGCGGGGLTPNGTVEFKGGPLSGGQITFEPVAGSGTTGAGAVEPIRDGKFQVPGGKAMTPGKYLVRITPIAIGSGQDLKTAPPMFKPYETTIELKTGTEPLAFTVPEK